jgi:hypothetical protein
VDEARQFYAAPGNKPSARDLRARSLNGGPEEAHRSIPGTRRNGGGALSLEENRWKVRPIDFMTVSRK